MCASPCASILRLHRLLRLDTHLTFDNSSSNQTCMTLFWVKRMIVTYFEPYEFVWLYIMIFKKYLRYKSPIIKINYSLYSKKFYFIFMWIKLTLIVPSHGEWLYLFVGISSMWRVMIFCRCHLIFYIYSIPLLSLISNSFNSKYENRV